MGMYDSVMLVVKCPFCGAVKERELQTKDSDCSLRVWRKGDYADKDYESFEVIAECTEPPCWDQKKNGGFGVGRFFHGNVFLENGIVTGKYEVGENDDQ